MELKNEEFFGKQIIFGKKIFMMNSKQLRRISTIMVFCLLLMLMTPVFAAQSGNYTSLSNGEGILYEETFKDSDGNNVKLTIEKEDMELRVKTFVNNILKDTATRKILVNGSLDDTIYYVNYLGKDGKTNDAKTLNANDFLKNPQSIGKTDGRAFTESPSFSTDEPSYPYITSEYSSEWGYRGYLYGDNTDTSTKEVPFYFDENTAVSIMVSTLLGVGVLFFTGFTVSALITTLGVSISAGVITSMLTGEVSQTDERWDYEVFVEDILTLVARIDNITTEVYSNDGYLTGEYGDIETTGPYENESEIIHYGIYLYSILYS